MWKYKSITDTRVFCVIGLFLQSKKLHLYTSKCNILRRCCDSNRLRFWMEVRTIQGWRMFQPFVIVPVFPPSFTAEKFNYIYIWSFKWQSWVGWRTARRDKGKESREDSAIWCSLISASGSMGSCAGPLCFQTLHRLVPSLYNSYVTYTDDPDASAFWNNMVRCAQIYKPSTFIKWKCEENEKNKQTSYSLKIKITTYTKGQFAVGTSVYLDE